MYSLCTVPRRAPFVSDAHRGIKDNRVQVKLDHKENFYNLKPIFHQNAKLLAFGTFVSPNAKDRTFASPDAKIPTCWYILRQVTQIFRVLADAKPKRKPVEYRLRWVPTQHFCVGHVHFMFFVYISFASGTERKPFFWWNMGFMIT